MQRCLRDAALAPTLPQPLPAAQTAARGNPREQRGASLPNVARPRRREVGPAHAPTSRRRDLPTAEKQTGGYLQRAGTNGKPWKRRLNPPQRFQPIDQSMRDSENSQLCGGVASRRARRLEAPTREPAQRSPNTEKSEGWPVHWKAWIATSPNVTNWPSAARRE